MFELIPAQYDWHLIQATIDGDLEGIQRACDCGASLSAKDERGRRLARIAIESNRHEALELLLRLGADPHGDATFSPMLCATACDNERAIRALAKAGASCASRHRALREPLHLACELGFSSSARTLLELGADHESRERDGRTPLMAAAAQGRARAMEAVLAKSPDLDTADAHGRTALFFAVESPDPQCVDILLASGANPRSRDLLGRTPLMAAAAKGRHAALASILSRQPTLEQTDREGRSALFHAIDSDSLESVKLLLEAGADPLETIVHKASKLRAVDWARLPNPNFGHHPMRPSIAQALLAREASIERQELLRACREPAKATREATRL